MNYDNFFFPTDDFEKCKDYYINTLGLSVKFDFSEFGMIAFQVGNEEPAIILKDVKKFPNAKPAVWIQVEDVKQEYKKLKSKGVIFLTEPFKIKTGWAVESCDPSGNLIGFADYNQE